MEEGAGIESQRAALLGWNSRAPSAATAVVDQQYGDGQNHDQEHNIRGFKLHVNAAEV
jgi:hypothetical protein